MWCISMLRDQRRCGKSVLLEQYQQRLLANGVAPEQIISINFENLDYEPLKDYMRLYNYLKERLCVKAEGREEGINIGEMRMLVKQVRKGRVTIEEAAEDAGMTVEEFKKVMENTPLQAV